jgi:DNA polymerase-1
VSAKETLMLIDVYSLLNRAFYGMAGRNRLTAPDGLPTGALFAFLNMLSKYRDELRPTHVVSALDMPGETFRHRKFDEYKKGRSPMPDDLARQVPVAREMLEYLGFQPVGMTDYEADDLIGTLSQIGEARGMSVKILTGDRDTLQLISDKTSVVLLTTKRDGSESEVITPDVMMDEYNLSPSQWVDVKGLMGDASDNIPGVRGVGQKTAIKLIQEYGSIDGVYENLGDMKGALLGNLTVGEQMAKLSRELSVICRSVPLEGVDELLSTDIDNAMDREALAQLLTRLNFRSFLERFNLTSPVTGTAREDLKVMADRIRVCASIDEWLPTLADDDTVAFMLPGNGGDGLLLTRQSCFHFSDPLPILHLIEQCRNTFVTWDFKRQLRKNGLSSPARAVFDVMIASYLLNELGRADDINFALRASLGDAYQPYEDSDLPLLKDLNAERKRLCLLLLQSMELQTDRLDDRGVSPLAQVEMELVNVLADLEHVGVLVDIEALETESSSMLEEIESLERSIYLEAGKEFNINSPQQLSEVLYEDLGLPTGRKSSSGQFSTAADELERLRGFHPIIDSIFEYRELTKLRGTFLEGLKKEIDSDGRIRTTYNQALTTTGRLSSSNPNLQNIPIRTDRGKRIRELFIASPGYVLIGADYSQIELRLLAHLSGDKNLSDAFNEGRDVHRVTASALFGKSEQDITAHERSVAKTVNFSITYGISDFGLSRDLGIPISHARRLINRYHDKYPQVDAWLNLQGEVAKEQGYVETLFHRRRYLPELQSQNRNLYNFGIRAAMNAPVQGTAADLIKIAMANVSRLLKNNKIEARLILQVHDELIIEASEKDKDCVISLLREVMEQAMELSVPLIADAKAGYTWGELS